MTLTAFATAGFSLSLVPSTVAPQQKASADLRLKFEKSRIYAFEVRTSGGADAPALPRTGLQTAAGPADNQPPDLSDVEYRFEVLESTRAATILSLKLYRPSLAGEPTVVLATYRITVDASGQVQDSTDPRPPTASGNVIVPNQIPATVRAYAELVFGRGLHDATLKEGEVYTMGDAKSLAFLARFDGTGKEGADSGARFTVVSNTSAPAPLSGEKREPDASVKQPPQAGADAGPDGKDKRTLPLPEKLGEASFSLSDGMVDLLTVNALSPTPGVKEETIQRSGDKTTAAARGAAMPTTLSIRRVDKGAKAEIGK